MVAAPTERLAMLTTRGATVFALLLGSASALDNGLGRTPPMGFNVRSTRYVEFDSAPADK
jgi:hypothetical protein